MTETFKNNDPNSQYKTIIWRRPDYPSAEEAEAARNKHLDNLYASLAKMGAPPPVRKK